MYRRDRLRDDADQTAEIAILTEQSFVPSKEIDMTSTQISVTPRATVRPPKVAGASLIGTAIEWYDYFIYGMAAAIVFGPLFFPSFSSIAGTLAAFATFSVSFIARPIGGAVMVLMGLVIRFTITESPDFEKVKSTHRDQRLPIVTVLRENLREVLLAAGAFIGINTVGYIFMAYLLSYSTKVLGISKTLCSSSRLSPRSCG